METSYQIRSAYRDDWQDAMGLAWKTFLRFEADVYTAEGVKNFENFITDSTLYRMFIMGAYQMFVAVADGGIVGMITLRDSQHISLLFVDERYHRQGIGRALLGGRNGASPGDGERFALRGRVLSQAGLL